MRLTTWLIGSLTFAVITRALLPAADSRPEGVPADDITWKTTNLDKAFRSEGVATADVNRDGKMDVLVGEVWYEAPDWKMHEIKKPGNYGDGAGGYSHTFACWADDFNGDGWPDLLVIDFPGAPCYWLENPRGEAGHWKQHTVWHSACNETPQYLDLLGTGKRVLLMGWQPKGKDNEGQMAYFTPGKDPTSLWEMHPVSEPSTAGHPIPGTFRFAHGLGAGDVNGDGRLDVLCTAGWWEQPAKVEDKPWTFHPVRLGDACADMYTYDVDGDGKADVLSSSAHNYGIWAHLQRSGSSSEPAFVKQDLFPKLVSQTHALHCVDINGDGLKDLVTGKRWWAHGPKGDADPNKTPILYWFEAVKKDGVTQFIPHEIHQGGGIGTQFVVADINGDKLLDVITSNKKGVFVHEQVRTRK
jgi:hypothetical protein